MNSISPNEFDYEEFDGSLKNNFDNLNNNDKSNSFNSTISQIKPLLFLLDKAEQILSIINLPESAVKKYNQLKEITFTKINMTFIPLISKKVLSKAKIPFSAQNEINSNLNNININNENTNNIPEANTIMNRNLIENLKFYCQKKNLIIEFLLELLDKKQFENVKLYKSELIKSAQSMKQQLDQIYNFSSNESKNYKDIDILLKMEDLKINEYLTVCDFNLKNFTVKNNLNDRYDKLSDTTNNNLDSIIKNYNNKIESLKNFHESQLLKYEERFNELKNKYKPYLEEENQNYKIFIKNINDLIEPIYEKFSKKKINLLADIENTKNMKLEEKNIGMEELQKINFLKCILEQLFQDNKKLIEKIQELTNEIEDLKKVFEAPFIKNTINHGDILQSIHDEVCGNQDIDQIEKEEISIINKDINNIIENLNENIKNFT